MRKLQIVFILAGVLAGWHVPSSIADDHVAWSMKRTYMGRTYPPQTSEIWISNEKTYVRDDVVVTITRQDLGKRWILNQRTKKYLEEPILPALAPPAPPKEEKFRIQEYGWNYEPVYEWSAKETGETTAIDGRMCAKILLTGEADYASNIRVIWISKDAPIDLGRYYARVVEPNLEAALLPVFRAVPALRDGLAVKTVITWERPIGNPMIWENVLTKLETVEPPAGIYELPSDYAKAKDRNEWAGR